MIAGDIAGQHIGTPCISVSWARCPQLRDLHNLYGKPGLQGKAKALAMALAMAQEGNRLIEWTARMALLRHSHGAYVSVENPFPRWLWTFPCVRDVWSTARFIFVLVTMQRYFAPRYKLTGILSNMALAHRLDIGEERSCSKEPAS